MCRSYIHGAAHISASRFSKQQPMIIKGNVPTDVTTEIMAIGKFPKMLNYPFKLPDSNYVSLAFKETASFIS